MTSSAPYRILCVDDEVAGLKLRQLILQRKGFLVSAASTVPEAMSLFHSKDFDLVVTDHLLGRETGTAMAREMKRLKPHIPIIVLSGATDTPEGLETADAFLSKAEGTESLLNKVSQLIAQSLEQKADPEPPSTEKPFSAASHRWELLAAIVESSDDAIFSKTLEGTILSWNKAAERMYGFTSEEIIGKPVSILLPPDRPNEVHEILERLKHGEAVQHMETVRVAKDGHLLTVSLTISPIHDHQRRVIGASTIARDISRTKLAEESLRNSEKLAVAGRMAATVAHEINNPLEAVTNALYLLAESFNLDASDRELLATAREELAKIRQITTLTLGLHRSDTDRPRPVKISELIENVLALYRRKLRSLGIAVKTQLDTEVAVLAFPGELRQVFSNLIVNAADALEKSGDKLSVQVCRSYDWKDHTNRGVRITVSDNGVGIAREKQPRIFEPFYTTKGSKGTGVGLWVSRGIVTKYGGRIRFKSSGRPGHAGTTFVVFLPALTPVEKDVSRERAA